MKRKALIAFVALNVVVVMALAGMFVLSEAYPLRPGGFGYRVQHVAEQWRMRLSGGEAGRAAMALELAERRLGDLAQAEGEEARNAAAVAFDRALGEAVRRVEGQRELGEELAGLLGRAELVLEGLAAGGEDVVVGTLRRQVAGMRESKEEEVIADVPEPVELAEAEPIPFLGQDIEHTEWPLTGGHKEVGCEECHEEGVYAGTAGGCDACHGIPESRLYAEHFAGACEECHLTDSWAAREFDHEGIVDCQSCHEDESPVEHYAQGNDNWWLLTVLSSGQWLPRGGTLLEGRHYDRCADCHTSTVEWEEVAFDHFGFTDCESCHELSGELVGHYEGQCSLCHRTEDWEPLAYEHARVEECRGCHAGDSPGEHYVQAGSYVWYVLWEADSEGWVPRNQMQAIPATCANCHQNTEEWREVEFDHRGYEEGCETCHELEGELAGHYEGACGNCHVVDGWEEVAFDHRGYSDCAECHELEEAHYPDQCSLCHTIDEWETGEFSHAGYASCSSCHEWETPGGHYGGACTKCHTTEEWGEIIYEHKRTDDCRSCHVPEFAHYKGQCSQCHKTSTWKEAIQPHSGLIGCGSCHSVAPGHYVGGCLNCHNTGDWEEVAFDHTNYDDCRVCHEGPEEHYPAQCSACHNTENWANYYVNHIALASCGACHEGPEGHWVGECSVCHSSESWGEIIYEHNVVSDCASCHEAPEEHWPGQCSLCHNMTNWTEVVVDHTVLTDCLSCHPTPYGHWPGQCSSCHGTSSWDEYTFNHDGYDNCKACHSQERPANHDRGQCSKCHNTESWSIPDTPTPTPTPTETPTATPTPIEEAGASEGGEATATPGTDSLAP